MCASMYGARCHTRTTHEPVLSKRHAAGAAHACACGVRVHAYTYSCVHAHMATCRVLPHMYITFTRVDGCSARAKQGRTSSAISSASPSEALAVARARSFSSNSRRADAVTCRCIQLQYMGCACSQNTRPTTSSGVRLACWCARGCGACYLDCLVLELNQARHAGRLELGRCVHTSGKRAAASVICMGCSAIPGEAGTRGTTRVHYDACAPNQLACA